MARDAKKRQKKLQKKNAKRKEKRAQMSRRAAALAAPALNRARHWPLEAAWITAQWREPEQLIQAIVARRGPHGHIALGNILIDTMCLGVKSAYGRITDDFEYQETLEMMQGNQEMVPADVDLLAKIVRDSVAYAAELGFRPDKDLRKAMIVLGDADPDASSVDVPLGGPDGRPYFFAGPHDNVDRIMNILMKKLGPDGFTYRLPMDEFLGEDMFEAAPNDSLGVDSYADEVHGDVGSAADDDGQTIVLDESQYRASN